MWTSINTRTHINIYMFLANSLDRYSCDGVGGLQLLQPVSIRCTDCYKTLKQPKVLFKREKAYADREGNMRMVIPTSVQEEKA